MSDEADRAQRDIDRFNAQAIIRSKRVVPTKTGYCAYCGEPCADKFCDVDCLNDWEREQKMKMIRGE